ncbi:hypothetical protein [Anabaena azotica]|uniref:Uncharacterized protein n=1 Tax=Anabaena azotica FACHB-119 TaxID=947527 RepID=A0ABR8D9T6_9NOST|nr:hypothetical protein [Anabaena azotica]MBD2503957.1 hypothetical protein [Anabaena azotica FACHB-119]
MPQKTIELRIQGNSIVIKAPFDRNLIEDIKVIPKTQRRWADPEWILALIDPNQQPDQETNLEYLIRVCRENAKRLGWRFVDYSASSEAEIKADKAKSTEELIDEFLAVVDELPNGALKLIRWFRDRLQLQLNYYLSEEVGGYDLFMRLYNASQEAFKLGLMMSGESRADWGFVFNIPYRDRVIRKLGEKNTTFIKYHHDLVPVRQFDDRVVHFHKGEEHYFGIPMSECDPSEINWQSQSWELFDIGNTVYWVCETKKFVDAWAMASKYSVAHFGGNFGLVYERPEQLSNRVTLFHLEEWLEAHIQKLAEMPPVCRSAAPWKYRAGAWGHPLDHYFDKGVVQPQIRELIESQKVIKAQEAVDSDRANAIELAKAKLRGYTKAELLKKYSSFLKSSWDKERILSTICTQEFAEKILELPVLET